ncbi:hypothetical protein PUV54_13190 [Hyphococcus flavus]|uniref:Nucleoside phosphorylase domain-containing protein n=1 Tax=Hyphococcus flavus TaxID=1866326 RepID=A0AAE9ZAU1_9PROT|nr:hypothetical protein [Hyphococcus flavus]WDI30908.1 hypothetical protein PUV54_13190 [Hyphococcus flavus]
MPSFIGVICGLKSEAAVVSASVDQSKIRIGVSGANAARAEEIAKELCEQGASAIISVGVSGGLDPALKPGDLIIGETVIADDGSVYASDRYLMAAIQSAHPGESRGPEKSGRMDPGPAAKRPNQKQRAFARGRRDVRSGYRFASLFGADEIIDSTTIKSALYHNHGCLAVDMESHGAARAAARAGAPFLAIRAIADPADRALPKAALNAVASDGSTRVLQTLVAALRDPKQFPELMKLGADSAAATKTLRRDLGPLFEILFKNLDV